LPWWIRQNSVEAAAEFQQFSAQILRRSHVLFILLIQKILDAKDEDRTTAATAAFDSWQ
jgi:hypothetical protein